MESRPGSAWFCVQVVFVLLRKMFGLLRFRQELLHLLLFLLAGLAGVYAARVLWETGTAYGAFSTPIRVAFFLPFYQLGFLYKKYLEQKLFKN